jgi:3-phenylpropionate/trans-cinnamate dioxygenase ferredoxin reductase subunit
MTDYQYLIIGGGMTAAGAVEGIRAVDPHGTIGLISAEADPPYKRPPLSKGLWKGDPPLEEIWINTAEQGATLHLGRTAVALDPRARQVTDDSGTVYTYEKLLLATGSTPRRLPFGGDNIIYYRTLADYRRLQALAGTGERFAVIGGGFIGSEIAAALTMLGKQVVLLFPDAAIGARVYPPDLAAFLNGYYREKGVDVQLGTTVTDVTTAGRGQVVHTADGQTFAVDGVVAGIGVVPNVALAREAGLEVGDGILVDEYLRTSVPTIYAAGDVAGYPDAIFGRRRVEHENQADQMGKRAGRAMAGQEKPYRYQPFFYSDLFDLGYEAVGLLDSRLQTVADWKEPYREGVVYYLQDGRVRGVLLWNVWDQVKEARKLLADPGPFHPEDLQGRLPVVEPEQAPA